MEGGWIEGKRESALFPRKIAVRVPMMSVNDVCVKELEKTKRKEKFTRKGDEILVNTVVNRWERSARERSRRAKEGEVRAMAQAVSHRLPTAADRVPA
jgi:hypothetical protein